MKPKSSGDVELAQVGAHDWERIREWLRRPHVSRWWGDPDESMATVSRHPASQQAIILLSGQPVGYLLWQGLSPEELAACGLKGLPSDHMDVDIFIGEADVVGRGVGSTALLLVVDQLMSRGVSSVGLGTDAANQPARGAFEKAGFRLNYEFEEEGRRMYYLTRDLGSAV